MEKYTSAGDMNFPAADADTKGRGQWCEGGLWEAAREGGGGCGEGAALTI